MSETILPLDPSKRSTDTIDFQTALRGKIVGQEEGVQARSEEHTSELQSQSNLVCRLLLEKKKRVQQAEDQQCCHPPQVETPGRNGATASPTRLHYDADAQYHDEDRDQLTVGEH